MSSDSRPAAAGSVLLREDAPRPQLFRVDRLALTMSFPTLPTPMPDSHERSSWVQCLRPSGGGVSRSAEIAESLDSMSAAARSALRREDASRARKFLMNSPTLVITFFKG